MRLATVRASEETFAKLDRLFRERRRRYASIVRAAIDREYREAFGDEPPGEPRRAPTIEPSVGSSAPASVPARGGRRSSASGASR